MPYLSSMFFIGAASLLHIYHFPLTSASFFFFRKKETTHGCGRGSHVDGRFDRQLGKQFIVRIVFAQEDKHRLIEDAHITQRLGFGTLSLVMKNTQRQVVVFFPGKCHTVREIYVFPVHEKVFVEQTAPIEGGTPQQHECSREHIDTICAVLVEKPQMITSEATTVREQFGKAEDFTERDPWEKETLVSTRAGTFLLRRAFSHLMLLHRRVRRENGRLRPVPILPRPYRD